MPNKEPTQKDYRAYWRLANQLTSEGSMSQTEIWQECEALFKSRTLGPRFKSVGTFRNCKTQHNKKRRLQSMLDVEGVAMLTQEDLEEIAEIVYIKMKNHIKKGTA